MIGRADRDCTINQNHGQINAPDTHIVRRQTFEHLNKARLSDFFAFYPNLMVLNVDGMQHKEAI